MTNPEIDYFSRKFIESARDAGHFSWLTPKEVFVLEHLFLSETRPPSLAKLGEQLVPPVGGERVRTIRNKAIRMLRPDLRKPIHELGLPPRIRNTLFKGGLGDLSLEELSDLSDSQLLGVRNFGPQFLQRFREAISNT